MTFLKSELKRTKKKYKRGHMDYLLRVIKMKNIIINCAFILVIASALKAEVIKVHSFGQDYSINITEEFCFDPTHPASIERESVF